MDFTKEFNTHMNSNNMKIFISHASTNKQYGDILVDLLRGVGVKEHEIIFTSNVAYGIPNGKNIFTWLKSQINEKAYVIYLLSKEYYLSIACLNEMGAAWIVENKHVAIFLPNFTLDSKEFQNGALDPREIGFFINNKDRLVLFIDELEQYFNITKSFLIRSQEIDKYLVRIEMLIKDSNSNIKKDEMSDICNKRIVDLKTITKDNEQIKDKVELSVNNKNVNQSSIYARLIDDIITDKLTNGELLLLHYIIETGSSKLGIGWQTDSEIKDIRAWEEINTLNNTLSIQYEISIKKFGLRGYTYISAFTGGGNPKEVQLKSDIEKRILDLPQEAIDKIKTVKENNKVSNDEDPFKGMEF